LPTRKESVLSIIGLLEIKRSGDSKGEDGGELNLLLGEAMLLSLDFVHVAYG